ncbi:MAG: hypothetical protein FWG85_01830 [Bacteroidetes bacterium]|nr:hypothetical protein [Bacteroidota bacterium]
MTEEIVHFLAILAFIPLAIFIVLGIVILIINRLDTYVRWNDIIIPKIVILVINWICHRLGLYDIIISNNKKTKKIMIGILTLFFIMLIPFGIANNNLPKKEKWEKFVVNISFDKKINKLLDSKVDLYREIVNSDSVKKDSISKHLDIIDNEITTLCNEKEKFILNLKTNKRFRDSLKQYWGYY